ncbi:Eco57I restriction-modification methylase domain-containing protein [Pyrococcus kukulkanii]|uniref:Eco57I restriction-modification methylase domain-containing protein n=1 Tax=Pyrococcus kukulkanii TaxID=1609559 RepID=UPI00356508C8
MSEFRFKRAKSLLESLNAKMKTEDAIKVFKDLFVEVWKFIPEDQEIDKSYLSDYVRQHTGIIQVIARTEPKSGDVFYVVYVETDDDTVRYRQKLIKNIMDFTLSLGLEFANFIIIFDVKGGRYGRHWKLVVPIYQRKLERAKLNIYVIDPEEKKFRTLASNLANVGDELAKYKPHPPASVIRDIISEHMLVRPLTEEFFEDYKKYYNKLKNWVAKRYKKILEEKCPRDFLKTSESVEIPEEKRKEIFIERAAKTFAHTFLNRLMFVYFLQKKGWIVELPALRKDLQEKVSVKNFVMWLHDQYEEYGGNFYRDYLRVLFLYVMNTPRAGYMRRDIEAIKNVPSPIVRDVFIYGVPYFNGGLFSPVKIGNVNLDEIITEIDDMLVTEIIEDFLESYNFTVTEETPYEVEVAVDPAMLGRIYESLIAEEERALEEEERKVSGIFYTPRAEVDFMCRIAVYEYLRRNTNVEEDMLKKFVFTPLHEWEYKSLPRDIINALENVKIVDPAAGSGAFLVGMFHLLVELYEKAGIKVDYERKLAIIRDNLYGVDIKDWAIRVAKLRLWLALIEEEEKIPSEPILPNLEAKLTVGDSLAPPYFVLRFGNRKKIIEIPFAKFREALKLLWAKKGISEAIVAYKELVKKYYMGEKINGKPVTLKDIEEAKWGVLQEFLESVLKEELKAKEKKEVRMLLEAVRKEDLSSLEKPPFIWELDFPDVMLEKRGFDIVIANPPYVRQEKIYPEYYDLAEFQMLPREEQNKLKREYKDKIKAHMEAIIAEKFGHEIRLNKRSDLYVYFFIQGVNLLNPRGVLTFITSNSWLDVDYGTQLQEFFLRFTQLRAVIDYTRRSFEQADINTVITVLTRKPMELFNTVGEECVNFVLLKRDFEEIDLDTVGKLLKCYAGKVKGIEVFGGKVYSYEDDDVRIRSVLAVELAKMGGVKVSPRQVLKVRKEKSSLEWWMKEHEIFEGEIPYYNLQSEYKGMKWGGILIRAPRIFYVILDKGKGKLVRLGEIAEVKFGIKTGANEFFYLEPIKNPKEWPVCKICGRVHEPGEGVVAVKNKAGWEGYIEEEFLKPVVKSPQEIKTYRIRPEDLKLRVFLCNLSKEELKKQGKVHALEYIEWGEGQGYQNKPTCRARNPWWALGNREIGNLASMMSYNTRFPFWLNDIALCDARLYDIYKKLNVSSELLASVLNTTLVPIIIELTGRANLGEGALDFKVYETAEILVVDPRAFSQTQTKQLLQAFERMANREIKSIFEELGLPKPNRDLSNIKPEDVSLDKVLPDRRELDRVIFEALGLTEEEQLQVYRAVVELVKARLVKAKTFSKKRKR